MKNILITAHLDHNSAHVAKGFLKFYNAPSDQYTIQLIEPCKEHEAYTDIIVSRDELVKTEVVITEVDEKGIEYVL